MQVIARLRQQLSGSNIPGNPEYERLECQVRCVCCCLMIPVHMRSQREADLVAQGVEFQAQLWDEGSGEIRGREGSHGPRCSDLHHTCAHLNDPVLLWICSNMKTDNSHGDAQSCKRGVVASSFQSRSGVNHRTNSNRHTVDLLELSVTIHICNEHAFSAFDWLLWNISLCGYKCEFRQVLSALLCAIKPLGRGISGTFW